MKERKIKVLFDSQDLFVNVSAGCPKYYRALTSRLKNNNNLKVYTVFTNYIFWLLSLIPISLVLKFPKNKKYIVRTVLVQKINKIITYLYIKFLNPDIIHITAPHDVYFLKYKKKRKIVITAHDLLNEHFNDIYPFFKNDNVKPSFINSDFIISISNFTKNELINYYNIDIAKIKVIHHGSFVEKKIIKIKNLPNNYLLYIGNRNHYKNFILFIKAISSILKLNENLNLLCIGGGDFTTFENNLLKELNLTKKVLRKNANDFELNYAYQNAKMFIYPSEHEGFGMPTLEAFANSCPVILNDIPIFREVAGDAALFFEYNNPESLREQILKLLNSEELRQEMIKKGHERLKNFSWEKCANETASVYEELMKK